MLCCAVLCCAVLCLDVEGLVCAANIINVLSLYRPIPCPGRYPFDWGAKVTADLREYLYPGAVWDPTRHPQITDVGKAQRRLTLARVLEKLWEGEDSRKIHSKVQGYLAKFNFDSVQGRLLGRFTLRFLWLHKVAAHGWFYPPHSAPYTTKVALF